MNPSLDDLEHLRQFEDQSLPLDLWHHRAHLKVAYLYLTRFTFEEALDKLRSGIRAYNAARGIADTPSGGYHETMTCAWFQLVHTTLRQFGPAASADAFFDTQTQLNDKRALLLFYSILATVSSRRKPRPPLSRPIWHHFPYPSIPKDKAL